MLWPDKFLATEQASKILFVATRLLTQKREAKTNKREAKKEELLGSARPKNNNNPESRHYDHGQKIPRKQSQNLNEYICLLKKLASNLAHDLTEDLQWLFSQRGGLRARISRARSRVGSCASWKRASNSAGTLYSARRAGVKGKAASVPCPCQIWKRNCIL